MKKHFFLWSALALASLLHTAAVAADTTPPSAASAEVAATTLPVNAAASSLTWNAKKFGGEHTGTVKLAKGALEVKGRKLVGGNFEIDMTSITDTDITNPDFNAKLTNHLKSEDFFSVEKHPSSTFKITKAEQVANAAAGAPNYTITGDLTIKGITHSITFPATVKVANDMAVATAAIPLDRTKWDIKYRSGMLGTAADKIIDDVFTVNLELMAGAATPSLGIR